jgi:hypothetical protein
MEELHMFRQCTKLFVSTLLILNIAGCGKSVDSRISQGLSDADTIFNAKPKSSTASTEHLQFYLPKGYKVKNSSDETNVILSKGNRTYSIFYNPNESKKSQHFYKALQSSEKEEIVKEKTYKKNGRFGFATVLKKDKESYEVIASTGGVKVTGNVETEDMNNIIPELMTIANSVQLKNK